MPDRAAIHPVSAQHKDISDGAVLEPLDRVDVACLMPPLGACRYFEAFLFGQFTCRIHYPAPGTVGGHRLLSENVLTRFHRSLHLRWFEAWRGRDNHIID